MQHAVELMFWLGVLWVVYQFALKQIRCGYCGALHDHEPHCPYFNTGTRMR